MAKVEATVFEDLLPSVDRDWLASTLQSLEEVSLSCMARTVPESSVVAYSAGIDSGIMAELQRRMKDEATLLTIGRSESPDAKAARDDRLSNTPGYRCVTEHIGVQDVENAALKVSKLVAVSSLSHFEDCVS
jgi:asparagine synthetase B (glutamine-hydrolysing)